MKLPQDGPWAMSAGDNDGNVVIVRSNEGYRELGSVPGYDHQVGIAVPLRAPESNGLPSPAEDQQLQAIEDALSKLLEPDVKSLLVAVITTSGMREFVLYTCSPEQMEQRFERLQGQVTTHQLQLMIQLDVGWEVYSQIS